MTPDVAASQDTRSRLAERLFGLGLTASEGRTFAAWLSGLPDVPGLHALSLGEMQSALGRIENARDAVRLVEDWRRAQRAPEPSGEEWLEVTYGR